MSFFKISEHCLVLIKFLTFSIYRHFLHQFPNPRPLQRSIEKIKHLCGQTNISRVQNTDFLRLPYSGTKTESSIYHTISFFRMEWSLKKDMMEMVKFSTWIARLVLQGMLWRFTNCAGNSGPAEYKD